MSETTTLYKTKNLTVRYLVALSLIALLSISAYILMQAAIYKQASDAPVLNYSGRQRMLSQKLTKEVLLLVLNSSLQMREHRREESADIVTTWSRVHNGLQYGDKELGLPGNNSREIQNLFVEMEPSYLKIKKAVKKILTLSSINLARLSSDSPLIKDIIEASPLYLEWMDRTVFQYDKEARTRVNILKRYETFIISTILLLLVLEALLIFRPIVKKIRRTYENFQQNNKRLIEEITERKMAEDDLRKSEEQLRHAQKLEAVGTLAGGVAHDFNNMLTSIIGYTEITMRNLGEESSNYGNLKQVLNASFRARDIVAQLMSYSRKTQEDKMPLQIDKIISDALKLLSTSLPTSISIKKEIEQDIEAIMGNSTQIQQILMNLCINAEHAMPESGTLRVALKNLHLDKFKVLPGNEISGAYVLISVEDNGFGMDKATMERIFDPFFTTKEVGKGTGLGLSTVYGIVKQHEGYITVDSEKGKGTVFNVYLPAIKQGTKTISAEKPVKTGKESALFEDKKRVLDSFEVKTTEEEIIINIHGNISINKTEKDKLLELYVLSRIEKKKIIVRCSSNVQQSLKEDGFDKFLEIRA